MAGTGLEDILKDAFIGVDRMSWKAFPAKHNSPQNYCDRRVVA